MFLFFKKQLSMKSLILTFSLIFITGCAQPNTVKKELITNCSQTTFCTENPFDSQCNETCTPCSENPKNECLKGESPCTCNKK